MNKSRLIVAVMILLLCSACSHPGGRHLNIWPLVYYSDNIPEQTTTLSILTPLVYFHQSKEGREFSIRPVFSFSRDITDDTTVVDVLYPLIKYKKRGVDRKFRIFPIMKDEIVDIFPNKTRTAHDYFPLYWGTSEEGRPYGGFFPIYGTIKDRFGKDDVLFLLWPVYSRTIEETITSHTMLWPVFKISRGDVGWGIRVFPLWGHEETTGKSYRDFFLFPIVTLRGRYLDTDSPLIDTLVIPFYVDRRTPHSRSTSYLWPFFTVSTNDTTGYRKIDIPWPFITIARSDTLSITQFAPFYRKRVTTEDDAVDESMYILYPIYKQGRFVSPEKTEESFRFMLIDKYVKTTYTDGTDDLWIYVFPLYNRRKLKSGDDSTVLLYPLPLYDDGFRRNYLPLFEIYRHETAPDGSTTLTILHHLLIREIKDGVERIEAPFYFQQKTR